MEIIHEVTLSQYAAKSVGGALKLGTRDSYGAEKIHVTRDETWAGLTITATFRIGGTAVCTPLDGQDRMDVPQEATSEAGRGTIVFVGTDGEQQIITKNLNYSVDDHDDAGGDAPNPTPDVWTQFVAQTKDNADRAELSADSANAAAAAAGQDADSAQRDARTAQQQAAAAAVLAGQVQQAAGQVQTDRTAAQAAAEQAGSSAAAVEESAAQAAEHRTAAEAAAQAAEDSAEAAESSATAAGGSAADAASSASAAAQAAENAAQSEANTADSAEAASSSAAAAADSKEAAVISEGRAVGSAKISESWAVGGTGIRAGEDTNNARYWAQLAQTVAQGAQGYFVTADALRAAHPTGQDGWWAIVGETDTIWIWDSDTGAWVDSSTSIDLSNYYTKQESDGRYATAAQGAKADTAVQTVNGKTPDANGNVEVGKIFGSGMIGVKDSPINSGTVITFGVAPKVGDILFIKVLYRQFYTTHFTIFSENGVETLAVYPESSGSNIAYMNLQFATAGIYIAGLYMAGGGNAPDISRIEVYLIR